MKKTIRKIVSLLMVIAMLLPNCITSFAVGETGTITIESKQVRKGNSAYVKLSFDENPGIAAATFKISYDSNILTLNSIAFNQDFGGDFDEVGSLANSVQGSNSLKYVAISWSSMGNVASTGTFLTMNFTVKENVESNTLTEVNVMCDPGDFCDMDENDVNFAVKKGALSIIDGIPGDINGDGIVNAKDLIRFRKYLSGWDVEVDIIACDCNGDGYVNSKDLIRFRKYASGWDVELKYGPDIISGCNHSLEAVAAKPQTCTQDGNLAYWHCTKCDKYYLDETAKNETTLENLTIAAGHELLKHDAKSPTTSADGNKLYWQCSICSKYYLDSSGNHETTWDEVVIPQIVPEMSTVQYDLYGSDRYLESVGIENNNPSAFVASEGLVLNDPVAPAGYRFAGWKTSTGEVVNRIEGGSPRQISLRACWEEDVYDVIYKLYQTPLEDTIADKYMHYTVSKGLVDLPNPTIYNYIFLGWYLDNGTEVKSIPAGNTGDVVLNAYWTSKRYLAKKGPEDKNPIIMEDTDNGIYYFTYEIGTIENVPLGKPIWEIQSVAGLAQQQSVERGVTTTKEYALTISETISEETVDSQTWTISEEWDDTFTVTKAWADAHNMSQEDAKELIKTDTNSYCISSDSSGNTVNTDNGGTSTLKYGSESIKNGNTNTVELEIGFKAGVDLGVGSMKFSADSSETNKTTHESNSHIGSDITALDTHTTTSTSSWNNSTTAENTTTASQSESFKRALSQTISEERGYGESHAWKGSEGSSFGKESSRNISNGTSSTVTYSETEYTIKTSTYSTDGKTEGCYRLVLAGTYHVFAVIGYDVASKSYFHTSYSVLDDTTYEFLDYSPDNSFKDYQNSALAFEIPIFVNKYVSQKTAQTEGIRFRTNSANKTATVIQYTGSDVDVIIPSYISAGNTAYKVTGINANVFQNSNVRNIILSEYIDEIPDGAFENCTELEGISGAFEKIGNNAFSGCTGLKEFVVPSYVYSIGTNSFAGVPQIEVNALNKNTAKALIKKNEPELNDNGIAAKAKEMTVELINTAVNSGANGIILDLSNAVEGIQFNIVTPSIGYFEVRGAGKTYNNIQIESYAKDTVLRSMNIVNDSVMPLKIHSKNLTLDTVNITCSSMALMLYHDSPVVKLKKDNSISSSSGKAIVANDPEIQSEDVGAVSGFLNVDGDVYVCNDRISQSPYLDMISGEIKLISESEFGNYSKGTYVITLNADGGSFVVDGQTVDTATKEVVYGSSISELPVPTKRYYNFTGWYTADNTNVADGTIYSFTEDLTLTAHWNTKQITVTFDANGGTTSTSSKTATCLSAYGDLPTPTRTGFTFNGWYTAKQGGSKVTSSTIVESEENVKLYAQWTVNQYTVTWATVANCTITVKRTSSPNKNAATGTLSSGAAVYYGDVLTVTYTAATGYSIKTKGSTTITVTRNITKNDIYATVEANSYTYKIVYKSSNGTIFSDLTPTSVTKKFGTTNTITPPAKTGYTTPAAQSVKWDSTSAKTITFVYTPIACAFNTAGGQWSTSPTMTYSAEVQYQNRTETSVQIRVKISVTIAAGNANPYGIQFVHTINKKHLFTHLIEPGDWKYATNSARTATANTEWLTMPIDTTDQKVVSFPIYLFQINADCVDMTANYGKGGVGETVWYCNVPAY